MVLQNTILFRVFDTHLGAHGMEGIGELWNFSASVLPQCGPSHILLFIVYNKVILFLYCVNKKIPSGINPIYSRLFCETLIPVSFPPIFDMGGRFNECKGDLFPIEKMVNKEITF
jgi:hypothetical protein